MSVALSEMRPEGPHATLTPIDDHTLAQVVGFHGHLCPGLAMGIQAAALALREVGPFANDAEIVAVIETDRCGVDAIQYLTGCTFGKGNLIHDDLGKNAFSFYRRSTGYAVRILARSGVFDIDPQHSDLFARVRADTAGEEEKQEFLEIQAKRSRRLLDTSPNRLYTVTVIEGEPPLRRRMFKSIPCDDCAEEVVETHIRLMSGRKLCLPCFEICTGRR